MAAYVRNMPEDATYWPPGKNDGFGGTSYGAPALFSCRWQNKQTLFRDAQGREVMSESVVYLSGPTENGGRLLRGKSAAAAPPPAAKEIRSVQDSPALRGGTTLHKVML